MANSLNKALVNAIQQTPTLVDDIQPTLTLKPTPSPTETPTTTTTTTKSSRSKKGDETKKKTSVTKKVSSVDVNPSDIKPDIKPVVEDNNPPIDLNDLILKGGNEGEQTTRNYDDGGEPEKQVPWGAAGLAVPYYPVDRALGAAVGPAAAITGGQVVSAAMDPRWKKAAYQATEEENYPAATRTAGKIIGKGFLGGQLADTPTAQTVSQVLSNALAGTGEGLGEGAHSVGKTAADMAKTAGQGILHGVENVFMNDKDIADRDMVEEARGALKKHAEAQNDAKIAQAEAILKQEMAKPEAERNYELIQKTNDELQTLASNPLQTVLKGAGSLASNLLGALTGGNPLAVVGRTLGAVAPGVFGTTSEGTSPKGQESLIDLIKESLSYSPLALGGWDIISRAAGFGRLPGYEPISTPAGTTGEVQPQSTEPRKDYFNGSVPASKVDTTETLKEIDSKYNTDLIKIVNYERMAMAQAKTGTDKLAVQKVIQDLKNQAITTRNNALNNLKLSKERAGDYGIYTQGSEDHKYITNISQGIKNFDTLSSDLDKNLTVGNYKSSIAVAGNLVQQMKKITQQDVPQELKDKLTPLIEKFEGLFGMFKGEVVNPNDIPIIWENLKMIRDEMVTTLNSYFQRPGANVPEATQKFLLSNERGRNTKEKTYVPYTNAGNVPNAYEGNKLALGIDADGNTIAIDKEGAPHPIQGNVPQKTVLMQSGKPAMWKGDKLVYADGSEVDSNDEFAHYIYHQPSMAYKKDKKGNIVYDADVYGNPRVDEKNNLKVQRLLPHEDTFNITYNKWTSGRTNEGLTQRQLAQQRITSRSGQDIAQQTAARGAQIGAQMPAVVTGLKAIGSGIKQAIGGEENSYIRPGSQVPTTTQQPSKKFGKGTKL